MGLSIIDVASYEAENVIDNKYFESYLDTNDEWIQQRTGIVTRGHTDLDIVEMTKKALDKMDLSNIDRDRIKMVICATTSSNQIIPTIAALAHDYLNLNKEVFSCDINLACSGFVGALQLAESFLNNGDYAICIGVEKLSSVVDMNDKSTCILFGDGAAVGLVKKNDIQAAKVYGTEMSHDLDLKTETKVTMNGRQIFKFATSLLSNQIENLLSLANTPISQIDHIVLHQANSRIIDYTAKKTGYQEKYFKNIDRLGNTSAASVGLCLSEMKEKKLVKKDDDLLLLAFGGGLTYAGMLVKWG